MAPGNSKGKDRERDGSNAPEDQEQEQAGDGEGEDDEELLVFSDDEVGLLYTCYTHQCRTCDHKLTSRAHGARSLAKIKKPWPRRRKTCAC